MRTITFIALLAALLSAHGFAQNNQSEENREFSAFAKEHGFAGVDPPLAAWAILGQDTFYASGSLEAERRELQADEVVCGEVSFGKALACKTVNPKVVVGVVTTRSSQDIHKYWLEAISTDFHWLVKTALVDCREKCDESAQFVRADEHSYYSDGSVWRRLIAAYCEESPSSTYSDLDGQTKYCSR